MIEIKKVTKKYGDKVALKDVSFDVNDGEIFAFIGHNGAGKTTLIKSIVGIHDFDEGDILINGNSIKKDQIKCKKDMAFVPDNPELYEHMKAIPLIRDAYDKPLSADMLDALQKAYRALPEQYRNNVPENMIIPITLLYISNALDEVLAKCYSIYANH